MFIIIVLMAAGGAVYVVKYRTSDTAEIGGATNSSSAPVDAASGLPDLHFDRRESTPTT